MREWNENESKIDYFSIFHSGKVKIIRSENSDYWRRLLTIANDVRKGSCYSKSRSQVVIFECHTCCSLRSNWLLLLENEANAAIKDTREVDTTCRSQFKRHEFLLWRFQRTVLFCQRLPFHSSNFLPIAVLSTLYFRSFCIPLLIHSGPLLSIFNLEWA